MRGRPALARVLAALTGATLGMGALPPPAQAATEVYPRPASGSYVVDGRGWGHGRGMSQWGMQGAALAGLGHEQILAFYYPGSTLSTRVGREIRVRLTGDADGDLQVQPSAGLVALDLATGTAVDVSTAGTRVRARAAGDGTLRVESLTATGWTPIADPAWPGNVVRGPVRFQGPQTVWTYQPGGERLYRGTLTAVPRGSTVDVVNQLDREQYLFGVVSREAVSSWQPAALRAQAVAARSYASFACNAGPGYDVLDTTACQVYGGVATRSGATTTMLEYASTNVAVLQTIGQEVTVAGVTQRTEFSATNGGWTVRSGTWPAKADPYDGTPANPRHRWTGTVLPVSRLEAAYRSVGRLVRLEILERDGNGEWGGRVLRARVVGSAGSVTVTGDQLRGAAGLYSDWIQPREPATPDFGVVTTGAPTRLSTHDASAGLPTLVSASTALGPTDDTWRFFLDRNADLVGVKLRGTGSGRIEVHVLSAASNYTQFVLQVATPVAVLPAGAALQFALGPFAGSGRPDLWLVQTGGTGTGTTEVHVLSAASSYSRWVVHSGTGFALFPDTDMRYLVGDGGDLVGVLHRRSGSGRTEVHIATAASGWRDFSVHAATPLGLTDDVAVTFGMSRVDGDRVADLLVIQRGSTGSGQLEAHALGGATGFTSWTLHAVGSLPASTAGPFPVTVLP